MPMINLILISLIINVIFFIYFQNIAKFLNLFDLPDGKRKLHYSKIPNIGGIILSANILIIFVYYFFLNNELSDSFIFSTYFFCLIHFLVGIYDDKRNLNPLVRLFLSGLIYYLAILFNDALLLKIIKFNSLGIEIFFGKYSFFVTILCILLLINALNMFDGINLQSGLYMLTIFLIFFIKGINQVFSLLMIISLFFFIYLNYKNKLFLGNSGVWFCSFYLGCTLISSHNDNLINVEEVLVILLIPGLDMFRLFVQRILSKKNPFKPDRNHIHHILSKSFSDLQTVFIIFGCYLIPIIIFYLFKNFIISLMLIFFLYIFLITLLSKVRFSK